MIGDLKLEISCKNHGAGCDFSYPDVNAVAAHEGDCAFRTVKCVILSCYKDIVFNNLEKHMAEMHGEMLTGDWVIEKVQSFSLPIAPILSLKAVSNIYAAKSWQLFGVRFF